MKENVITFVLTVVCLGILGFLGFVFMQTTGGSFFTIPIWLLGIGAVVLTYSIGSIWNAIIGFFRGKLPQQAESAQKGEALNIVNSLMAGGMKQEDAIRLAIHYGEIEAAKRRSAK